MEIRDTRETQWCWIDNEYLNGYAKFLSVSSTAVYLSLCRHADNKTQSCFPSMRLVAEELGVSTKTVERATMELEEWGIISVKRSRKPDGTQANNVYTLASKKSWVKKPRDNMSVGADRQKRRQPTDTSTT